MDTFSSESNARRDVGSLNVLWSRRRAHTGLLGRRGVSWSTSLFGTTNRVDLLVTLGQWLYAVLDENESMDQTKSRRKVLLSWSSGKDSAWALHVLRQHPELDVVALLTTINGDAQRVAMHAVRTELLAAQADAAGLPLHCLNIPWPCTNADYESTMARAIGQAKSEGVSTIAFGDLFLEDIRQYRMAQFAAMGVEPIFPLWNLPTRPLASEMIGAGLKARLTCIDPRVLGREFAGCDFDGEFLNRLPSNVDPCGERGEFHSFAYDGPMFQRPIAIRSGEIMERDGFIFADLHPGTP